MPDNAALLIKDQQLSNNNWQLIDKEQDVDLSRLTDSDHIILPFARWQENQSMALGKANIGLWLDSDEPAEPLASICHDIPLIAINFPIFSDGRGYSTHEPCAIILLTAEKFERSAIFCPIKCTFINAADLTASYFEAMSTQRQPLSA